MAINLKIITVVNESFTSWINEEVEKRGWSYSELARRGRISQGAVSLALSGDRNITTHFCNAIARAFGMPPEDVLRLAGLLPPLPDPDEDMLNEVTETFKRLPRDKRREVLNYAKWQLSQNGEG